jgi:hypothetical protein
MKYVEAFFSSRLVQLVLALTWARLFFPDWVEAVGSETVLRILGGS